MKNSEASVESPSMTIDFAKSSILEIRQRIAVMGANDSEFHSIDEIISDMESMKIEPAQAVEQASLILNGKQDYH
jgi:hypothetical protein